MKESPRFLDMIENGYASESNPHRIGIYIRSAKRTGRLNPGKYMVLTDGKGDYWELGYDNDRLEIIGNYAQKKYQEAEKAYGGCHNCYGKGYATQSSSARGRGISWDTSGPVFCGCDRGEQLETLMKEGELNGAEAFSVQLALAFMDDESKAVIKTELEDYKSFKSQLRSIEDPQGRSEAIGASRRKERKEQ